MSITLRDLLPRVMMYRPELDDAKGMFALTEAARRLGQTAAIFRYPSIHNALTVGEREFVVGVDSEFKDSNGNVFRVENVAVANIPEGLEYAGPWNARTNTPYLGKPRKTSAPMQWTKINQGSGPTIVSPNVHHYNGKIMLYGAAKNPAAGDAYRTAIKVYDIDTDTWNSTILWLNEPIFRTPTFDGGAGGRTEFESLQRRNAPTTPDGRALIWGGTPNGSDLSYSQKTWIYDFKTHTVSDGPALPATESICLESNMYDVGDGQYLLAAGQSIGSLARLGVMWIWDINIGTIVAIGPRLPQLVPSEEVSGTNYSYLGAVGRKFYFIYKGNYDYPYKIRLYEYDIDLNESRLVFKVTDTPADVDGWSYRNPSYVWSDSDRSFYAIGGTSSSFTNADTIWKVNVDTGVKTNLITIAGSASPATSVFMHNDYIDPDKIWISNLGSSTVGSRTFGYYLKSKNKFYNAPKNMFGAKGNKASYFHIDGSLYAFTGDDADPSAYHEVFNPARQATVGLYYTVSEFGNTVKSGIDSWDKGDVIYSDGENWMRIRLDKFIYIPQMSDPLLNKASAPAEFGDGLPNSWWQRNGKVYWTVRPDRPYPVRLDLSYAPTGNEVATVEIPSECESVIVDGALSMLYMLPGQNMSPQLATAADMRFKKGMATVRAIGMFGYGGTPQYYSGQAFGPQWNAISINWMER